MKTMMRAAAAYVILGACTLGDRRSALAAPTRITWTDSGNNQSGRFEGHVHGLCAPLPVRDVHRYRRGSGIEAVHTCSDGTFTFKTQTPGHLGVHGGWNRRYSTLRAGEPAR